MIQEEHPPMELMQPELFGDALTMMVQALLLWEDDVRQIREGRGWPEKRRQPKNSNGLLHSSRIRR